MSGLARFPIRTFRWRSTVGVPSLLLLALAHLAPAQTEHRPNHQPPPALHVIERQNMRGGAEDQAWRRREHERKLDELEEQSWHPLNPERPLRIIFPANPPPLRELPTPRDDDRIPTTREIAGLLRDTLEPYFAPLSTRLIEPDKQINKALRSRLQAYRETRDRLRRDLGDRLAAALAGDPATRQQELAAFAVHQQADLEKLEAEGERLRDEFTRNVNWFAARKWRLGKGELQRPREELRGLEHQVLRASAFYEDGLSPAQRRLAREAALLLETPAPAPAESPDVRPEVVFFSPDLLRMPAPQVVTPECTAAFRDFCAAKDALREDVRNAIFESELVGKGARRQRFRQLVIDQEPKFAALDDLADAIRAQLAASPGFHRASVPRQLPAGLDARITEYITKKQEILIDYHVALRAVVDSMPPAGSDPAAKARLQKRIETARTAHLAKSAPAVEHVERLLGEICTQLSRVVTADDPSALAVADDAGLRAFLGRHRHEQASHEYDLAAFEPGLSPAQRRLLLAGAVDRLDLPFLAPEIRPSELPQPFRP